MAEPCTAVKGDGERCNVRAGIGPSGLCVWHDPNRAVEAAAMRSRGGSFPRGKTVVPEDLPGGPPETLEDVILWASWATVAVATGRIDARTSREISSMLTTLRFALERRDLKRQVEALTRQVEALRREGK